jgi:uncharacterized protein
MSPPPDAPPPPSAPQENVRSEPEFEEETDNYRVAGYTSQDRMRGLLQLERKQDELDLAMEDVLRKIKSGGISFGVSESAVREALDEAAESKKAQISEIAWGLEPEEGTDGKVEFYVQPSSEEARYTKDEHGRINYHELNLIENVLAGKEIARVLPPTPGTAGSDVLGEVIPAKAGDPARLRPGKSVKIGDDGETYLAEVPGRVVYEDDCVEISQVFEVRGDVDYSVGNLDFVGHVTVTGEILDDFNVKADMGIEVRGPAGNCKLISDGDVILGGGVSGKTKGVIRAGGKVHARYLNEVNVEANGDVIVDREAYNSCICSQGAYVSPKGKVVGGSVTALKGIEAGTAGSDLGVVTKLWSGVDFRSANRRRSLAEAIDANSREIERISTAIGPLLSTPQKIQLLPADKKKAVLNLVSHLKHLKEQREQLDADRIEAPAAELRNSVRQINIKDKAYQGITAEIGECRLLLKNAATGPLTMVEDLGEGSIRLMPYQPLGGSAGPSAAAAAKAAPKAPPQGE